MIFKPSKGSKGAPVPPPPTHTNNNNKKDHWDSGNRAHQQTTVYDIQIKVVILLLANISIPCRSPSTQNLNDLDFDLSRSLKVKVMASLDSPYMVSYQCSIVTLGLTLYEI